MNVPSPHLEYVHVLKLGHDVKLSPIFKALFTMDASSPINILIISLIFAIIGTDLSNTKMQCLFYLST